jgi:hypothetical protein
MASLALWALLAWLDRLAVICALAFFAALGFGIAGLVEADVLSGTPDVQTVTTKEGDVDQRPDDCQPGVPYLDC